MTGLFRVLPNVTDVEGDERLIRDRLERHLLKLRETCEPRPVDPDDEADVLDWMRGPRLGRADINRIRDRAVRLLQARVQASGVGHIEDATQRDRILSIAQGVRVAEPMTEARADEIAADLHEDAPWTSTATEAVWHSLRRSARRGESARIAPLLLVGEPGVGKSHWARRLSGLLGVRPILIDAGTSVTTMTLCGLEKGWRNGGQGIVARTILTHRVGDPLVFLDEIDKAGDGKSDRGHGFALADGLLAMTEDETARAWMCPYHGVAYDLRRVSWVMAGNDARRIPAALLSRLQVVQMRPPSRDEIDMVIARRAREIGLGEAATGAALDALGEMWASGRRMGMRDVGRLLQRAESLEGRPTIH